MAKKQASDLKEEHTELLNKRFRLTMDFTMKVCEITHETLRNRFRASTELSTHILECARRENRLLLSLFRNKKLLKKVMLSLLVDEARARMDEEQDNVFGMEELVEILEPIYTRMDKDDAEYFQGSREVNCFFDSIEMFLNSFDIKCKKADIEEVQVFVEGDVERITVTRLITK
jgi:hypothetical protein